MNLATYRTVSAWADELFADLLLPSSRLFSQNVPLSLYSCALLVLHIEMDCGKALAVLYWKPHLSTV